MEDVHDFEPRAVYRFVVRNNHLGNDFSGMYWIYQFVRMDGHNYVFRLLELGLNGRSERPPSRPLRDITPEVLMSFNITKIPNPGAAAPAAGGKRKTKKSKRKRNNKKKNTRRTKNY